MNELWKGDRVPGTLSPSFFERETTQVARALLGKLLVVRSNPKEPLEKEEAQVVVGRILETEAYSGEDPASHSAKGITPRCAPMFEAPGRAYVYFIYGMYEMLNFVTEKEDQAGAVLIRAVEPLWGQKWMSQRRKKIPEKNWANGPGRLTRAFGIERRHNRALLSGPELYVVDDGFQVKEIASTPRVGIREGVEKYWRYLISGHSGVSPVKENRLAQILEDA